MGLCTACATRRGEGNGKSIRFRLSTFCRNSHFIGFSRNNTYTSFIWVSKTFLFLALEDGYPYAPRPWGVQNNHILSETLLLEHLINNCLHSRLLCGFLVTFSLRRIGFIVLDLIIPFSVLVWFKFVKYCCFQVCRTHKSRTKL